MSKWLVGACCLLFVVPFRAVADESDPGAPERLRKIDFAQEIRPILFDKCVSCHGPDQTHREADLRLDTEDGAKADLGGYRAVHEGSAADSELVRRIMSDDEFERMPPPDSGKSLTKDEIDRLVLWVEQGAPWAEHWAYQRPKKSSLPSVNNPGWARNWIDRYLMSAWEANDIIPAADADPVTLVRRLHWDLIGLPPSPETVGLFCTDPSPLRYEQLVDQLLASPHFGERLAMYWLDLVRYADTVGYHGDQDHSISPYRDYVIDALNRDMPFDQFTREQLAGDLLPNADVDQRIASGYNRLLQTSHEGGVQPKEYLSIYAADRVRNVSAVWMGATLGCAQCHDHKYDPHTTKDFYAMAAFFADVDEARHFAEGTNALPTSRPPEEAVLSRTDRSIYDTCQQRIASLQARERAGEPDESGRIRAELKSLQRQLRALQQSRRMTMITVALESPRPTRILPRGNWLDESGPIVQPAVPEFLGQISLPAGQTRASRRDLANWFVDPVSGAGGLTARVFANRFWYLYFGQGLSRSLEDFGGQGEAPLLGELLDQLALEFIRRGWDTKAMIRLLVTSRAYQLSSIPTEELRQSDPGNAYFARQARYRLAAELVRDNALSLSGLLVREIGGPSVKPYQPEGYYRHLNFPPREYRADNDRQQWRRGVYVHWQRQFLHPTMKAMDAPNREECTAQRARSNTPLAALALLNDPSFVEAARMLACNLLANYPDADDATRIEILFRQVTSRTPDAFERAQLEQLLNFGRESYAREVEPAQRLLKVGLAPVPPGIDPAELAALSVVTRACLNLHEVVTRN